MKGIKTTETVQQAIRGFNTISVISGYYTIRVHESLGIAHLNNPNRYFISVDFKFKEHEALNMGKLGLLGCTKSEATKDAKSLSQRLNKACCALNCAKLALTSNDTANNRFTVELQQKALDKIVSRFSAEFV